MTYTGYQLLWFFLIYSFVGWCGEVAVSVIKQHKFVNRGFVTGPLCPIYGMGAFAFAIFLPDLKNDWIFLFLGSMILASFLGDIVETIFMLATTGKLVCRSSVVYGQFSIVWGLACVLATIFLYQFREKSDRYVFLWGTILGGAYEYVCSVFTEVVFGAVFMIINMVISSAAVIRYTARNCEPTAANTDSKIAQLIDERFPDERMVKRYPYMRFRR